jgi:hypothetical protein
MHCIALAHTHRTDRRLSTVFTITTAIQRQSPHHAAICHGVAVSSTNKPQHRIRALPEPTPRDGRRKRAGTPEMGVYLLSVMRNELREYGLVIAYTQMALAPQLCDPK